MNMIPDLKSFPVLLAIVLGLGMPVVAAEEVKKPNIVIYLIDDLGVTKQIEGCCQTNENSHQIAGAT